MKPPAGLFLTLEGCEGCGKSTQAKLLFNWLNSKKVPALLTQEPGGTPLGDKIRDILKIKRNFDISPMAEMFLFSACRTQLVADVINPALNSGQVVICDRFTDSTIVYQGYGRGLDVQSIRAVNKMATGGLRPDLIILLDTEPGVGLGRKRNSSQDRFETEDIAFHRRIREAYLKLAVSEPGRWLVIESGHSIEKVKNIIQQHIMPLLKARYPFIDRA
jgi:dTMP kinase